MTDLTDRGYHKTKEDLQEEELKAAGWIPTAKHPHSATWWSPDGQLFGPLGYAWHQMKAAQKKV